uniref:NADH-ubiquinone oxidoreductase chain 4L n=1 Tax=Uzeldikra longiprocessa TaxID=2893152 RepID=A0A9E7BYG6_9HEMI|nr:NADH dehydrogenase subunit 4L [Uzeldikra longiprocessa]UGN61299.1 NADH dehydrogenase subunit 4L [Uzeldikra longiprocessa]
MMIYYFMFFMGMFSFIYVRKHILLCLISLEFIVISLLLMVYDFCLMFDNSYYIYLVMMTFYVCEGVMGLSVMVTMIRSYGNDYLNSMFLW